MANAVTTKKTKPTPFKAKATTKAEPQAPPLKIAENPAPTLMGAFDGLLSAAEAFDFVEMHLEHGCCPDEFIGYMLNALTDLAASYRDVHQTWRNLIQKMTPLTEIGATEVGEILDQLRDENSTYLGVLSKAAATFTHARQCIIAAMVLGQPQCPIAEEWAINHIPVATQVFGNHLLILSVRPDRVAAVPQTFRELYDSVSLTVVELQAVVGIK